MMHDILYYVAMTFLVAYTVVAGGALGLAVADEDSGAAKPILLTATVLTGALVVLMAVFHG